MKYLIPVTAKFFGAFKLDAIQQSPHDYYNRVGSRSSSSYRQSEARDGGREVEFVECVIALQNTPFPFNIFKSVHNHTWGYDIPNAPRLGDDWAIYTRWGYHINHERQCYAYSTCAGNFYGVYKDTQTGEFFAFASGARSVIANFVSLDDVVGEPVIYETTAPADMKWYETQADYLIRKGELHTARHFAKEYHGVPADYNEATQNEWDARAYFLRQNPNFDELVLSQIFATPAEAEQYLLNRYRNKKINPTEFIGKDLVAWNMLAEPVQARIAKYA